MSICSTVSGHLISEA